jgi:hypothetical protein
MKRASTAKERMQQGAWCADIQEAKRALHNAYRYAPDKRAKDAISDALISLESLDTDVE